MQKWVKATNEGSNWGWKRSEHKQQRTQELPKNANTTETQRREKKTNNKSSKNVRLKNKSITLVV